MKTTITLLLLAFSLSIFPQSQLSICGYTANAIAEIIYANPVTGANAYRFQFVNTANSFTTTFDNAPYPATAFYAVSGTSLGVTYTVSVATSTNNGSTWSGYGTPCSLTAPSDYTTKVIPSDCGVTSSSWAQLFTCYPSRVIPADYYEFRLQNAGLSYAGTFTNTNQNFNFTLFSGLLASTPYTVDIRVYYNGSFQNYGPGCTVTTPPAPTTSLQVSYCGFTAASYSELIYAEDSPGSAYRYRLQNAGLPYSQTFDKSNTNFILSQFTGLQNSTTYSVDVAVFYNGSYGPYGNVCQVTTPAAPTSSIISTDCGLTASSYTNQLFRCEDVPGFDCYFYSFTDGVTTYTLEKCNNNNFILSQLAVGASTLANSTTYNITVKVKYGGVYGPFGNSCTITTPGSYMRVTNPLGINEQLLNNEAIVPVRISDIYGREYDKNVELPHGIYFIQSKESVKKVIKQ